MFCAKRWVASDVPPIDCFGSTNSSLAWDYNNDLVETRCLRSQWSEATELLITEFKADRERKGVPSEWSHPLMYLENYMYDIAVLGDSPLSCEDSAPKSLFSKSSKNGMRLYSPYLCGTGIADMLSMSYEWVSTALGYPSRHCRELAITPCCSSQPLLFFDKV